MNIKLGNEDIAVQVIRSRRKTCEIRITPEGALQVRGPLRMAEKKMLALLEEKSDWIRSKLEVIRKSASARQDRQFKSGDGYPYLGKAYPLHIVENANKARVTVVLEATEFLITTPKHDAESIRIALEKWSRKQAAQILPERVRIHEARMGLKCMQVTVKDQKKRWGSCSSRGNINLNWRLVLMPPEVMDSVVIHELAHLVHPNHSAHYYQYLSRFNPAYKDHDRWLKGQGRELFF